MELLPSTPLMLQPGLQTRLGSLKQHNLALALIVALSAQVTEGATPATPITGLILSAPKRTGGKKVQAKPKGGSNPAVQRAASRGSTLHSDKPGNLPDQLRAKYPETEFEFKKPGQNGQDVVVKGGKHPSEYPNSTWKKDVNHADFKPDTPSGQKTFDSDRKHKWQETQMLPYEPQEGKLK